MFRPLLLASSVALVIGGSAAALAAPSASAHRAFVCPLASSTTNPCCGPVTGRDTTPCCDQPAQAIEPICCPANAQCSSSLTIGSSPDPSTAGQSVIVSGEASGAPSGTVVSLFQRLPGQSGFTKEASAQTDTSGKYTITLRGVQTNRQWYVTEQSDKSTTISQSVRATVSFNAVASSGSEVSFSGRVRPAQAGSKVLIEQLHAGAWRVVATTGLGHTSRYKLKHHFAQSGRIELRAELRGNASNAASYSHSRTITVG